MTSLHSCYAAFEAAPHSAEAQARLAELLLAAGSARAALSVLEREDDGSGPWSARKKNLIAIAYDGIGERGRASVLNAALQTDPICAAWAYAAEAIAAAVAGQHDDAVAGFRAAALKGLLEPQLVYKIGWQTGRSHGDLGFLLGYFPHWRDHHQTVLKAVSQGFAQSGPEHHRLHQPDALIGPVRGELTLAQEHRIEVVLETAWRSYDAAPPSAGYGEDQRNCAGRSALCLLTSRFDRFGTSGEAELWVGVPRGMATAGLSVERFGLSSLLGPDAEGAVRELDQLVTRLRPDMILIEADPEATALARIGPARLTRWRQEFGVRLVTLFTDTHEHFRMAIEPWVSASDLCLMYPFDGIGTYNHVISGDILPVMLDPGLTTAGAAGELPQKDIGFYFSGSVNAARLTLVDQLSGLFETKIVRCNNLLPVTEPVPYDTYRAELKRSRFTVNSGQRDEYESPRGRTAEAIACGALALEFGGVIAAKTYVPYVHFVPFANLDQAEAFTRFLIRYPDWRDRIAAEGRRFHFAQYGADRLWGAVFARLDRIS